MKGHRRRRRIKLGPFKPCLTQRWEETGGQITGLALHAEIAVCGFTGAYRLLSQWKRQALLPPNGTPPPPPPPSVRQVTGWPTLRKAVLAHWPRA
ncbi:hypothetical protein ACWIG3_25980 [Streptomyces celluloflavus]|uniref:hypothetical protein n=1 Tax=Streptomyces celluloflavus TaxID=58344 RepID=UPI0036C6DD98